MSRPHACIFATCLLSLAACALAQTAATPNTPTLAPVLQILRPGTLGTALERPVGGPVKPPRTSGGVNLKGKQVYIAEYLVLFDLSGEIPVRAGSGQFLGTRIGDEAATLVYRSAPDIAALQLLTDRAWADLLARLASAGVVLADAAQTIRQHGAVYAASEPASTPAVPVVLEAKVGNSSRRYLALAPTGMGLVPRTAAGIGLGDITARVAYPAKGIEALSLAMALNLSVVDSSGGRSSTFAARTDESSGASSGSSSGPPSISPLMELAPAPAAALVHAHAQLSLVNLDEALLLAGEFGQLRSAPPPATTVGVGGAPLAALTPLLSLGRRLLGEPDAPRVHAVLTLDGPGTARLVLYATGAANQAITDALKAGR